MKALREIYEVRRGDHMHNAGWSPGWYWETPSSEPHGPYRTELGAHRAAKRDADATLAGRQKNLAALSPTGGAA